VRHAVVVLDVVRAEEKRHFARRYKIRQVIDCGMIGAELLEASLLKLTPAARVKAKPGPEAGARGNVLPHVEAGMFLREPARPDPVDEHPRAVRGLGRLVDALSHLTPGRSFMHDKNNSNSRGKTTGAALDKRLSQGHTRPRATRRKCYSKTNWTP
jgi:hypothetical protein